MGWWDWIAGTLSGRHKDSTQLESSPVGGVAVLERRKADEDPQGPEWWVRPGATAIELTAPRPPHMVHEDRAFENLLASGFDGHNLTLPPMPGTMERVLNHLGDPKCEFGKLAQIISEDQANVAAVLRLANSPMYRGVNEITSLQLALSRLGSKAIRTLMMHQALRKSMFGRKASLKPLADLVWRRSLASASIMRELCQFTRLENEDASLLGLLHDIGNVMVVRCAQDAVDLGNYRLPLSVFEYLCHECQQEFGELIAHEWKLPEVITKIIVKHHAYPCEDDELRTERIQLHLADMIICLIGYGPDTEIDFLNSRPVQDLELQQRPEFVEFLRGLPSILDEQIASL